jgi:SAM-dependent methyltransferase
MAIEEKEYIRVRRAYWDDAATTTRPFYPNRYYKRSLIAIYRNLIPPGQKVLEIGCGSGELLAGLQPSHGVGVDFSGKSIARAQARYPDLAFMVCDAQHLALTTTFDYIILSDLTNDVWDVQAVLQQVIRVSHPRTRIITNNYNRLWELPLNTLRRLGLLRPALQQNWLSTDDIINLFRLSGGEVIRDWEEILVPVGVPLISSFCNRILVKLFPFKYLALTSFIVARPVQVAPPQHEPQVSVIIAARNEAGNIKPIISRIPQLGSGTEIIFVEGHSHDNSYATIQAEIANPTNADKNIRLFRQNGDGKGDAVRLGFAEAHGEILMILDADMTVPPEKLRGFYEALVSGKGDFINGVRLVYPMEKQAMRYFNLLGNKFFSFAFSWLLGQPIKDTLCGTKVLWRSDYQQIAENRAFFGDFDPFGDFDLLFGAARLNLKIVEFPIRYEERSYGDTNINRWQHGFLLLKMVLFACKKIKFN